MCKCVCMYMCVGDVVRVSCLACFSSSWQEPAGITSVSFGTSKTTKKTKNMCEVMWRFCSGYKIP